MDHLLQLLSFPYPAKEMQGTYLALTKRDRDTHSAAIDFLDSVLDQDLRKVVVPIFDAPGPDQVPWMRRTRPVPAFRKPL
jgi:hypothetical protein